MEWIEPEALRFFCPLFANELVRRETLEGLQPSAEVVGVDEQVEMLFELPVAVIVKAFDGGFLDGAVHPLDLAVGPRVLDLGQTVLDAVLAAAHAEHMLHVAGSRTTGIARQKSELDPIVGENSMDLVGDGRDQGHEECGCGGPAHRPEQLYERELAGAINGNIEIELAFGDLNLCNVDMEIADRVSLELLPVDLVALHLRQPRDIVALQAAMQ